MTARSSRALFLLALADLAACTSAIEAPSTSPSVALSYAATLVGPLAARVLAPAEIERLEHDGRSAIEPLLRAWVGEDGFALAARGFVEERLETSGVRNGIDFSLPGNLAEYTVRHRLPFSTLLTADYCVDGAGRTAGCDTGAPYRAGVLTTRAYLVGHLGRFNLARAHALVGVFACLSYPMDAQLEPRIAKQALIPMFRAESAQEQMDPRAANAFGNGFGCYQCHGQFSMHAQLFVRFDTQGRWREDTTGLQDPDGELGRSTGNLYASHMADPAKASSERSQLFGHGVANLTEAAAVMAQSDAFRKCTVRNLLSYVLPLGEAPQIDPGLVRDIADRLRALPDPTLADIAVEIFRDERVIAGVTADLAVQP